jgi:hypothetical protein
MFAIYDANGDGYITEAEFVADGGTPSMFRELNVSAAPTICRHDESLGSAKIQGVQRNRVKLVTPPVR